MHKLGKSYKLLNQPHEYGMPAGSLMSYSTGASAESQILGRRPEEGSWQGSLQEQGWLGILELDIVPFADEIHQHLGDNINAQNFPPQTYYRTLGTLKENQKIKKESDIRLFC